MTITFNDLSPFVALVLGLTACVLGLRCLNVLKEGR